MTTLTVKEKKIEFSSVIEVFNYIADNFNFKIEELETSEDFLNNKQNNRLDRLLSNINN